MILFSLLLTGLTAQAGLICQSADSSYSVEYLTAKESARGTVSLAGYEIATLSCQKGEDDGIAFTCVPNKLTEEGARATILRAGKSYSTVLALKGHVIAKLPCAKN